MKESIRILTNVGVLDSGKALEILANKVEKTYNEKGFKRVYEIMNIIPYFLFYSEFNPNIIKIDEFLTSKFEEICSTNFEDFKFNFKYINKLENFKEKIRETGTDFFVNFPIGCSIHLDECKDIANTIFGEFTSENFSKIRYGYKNPTKAAIIKMVIDELLKRAGSENMNDVKQIGSGVFSVAYIIGERVLKLGIGRINEGIPNHPRILAPIVRRRIDDVAEDGSFLEIQNLVDTNWHIKMRPEDIYEVVLAIYSELRDAGYVWVDPKIENIGKLLKPNTTHFFDLKNQEINPPENATCLIGNNEGEPLQAGEYVIIDSDLIYREKEWKELKQNNIFGEVLREGIYEIEYQKRKNNSLEL